MAIKIEDYMQWPEIEALEYAECEDVEKVLGPKKIDKSHVLITAYMPEADNIKVIVEGVKKKYVMDKMDDNGYFAVVIQSKNIPQYKFVVSTDGKEKEIVDAYSVEPMIDAMDMNYFNNGRHKTLYNILGARKTCVNGCDGTYFSVWAPNAKAVSVVGDFNSWNAKANPMRLLKDAGIYEVFVPGVKEGDIYKFEIWGADGSRYLKADPFAQYAEKRPDTASVVWSSEYKWDDSEWLKKRKKFKVKKDPVLIYEVNLLDYKDEDEFLNYKTIADKVVKECEAGGFTYVGLMPVMEYPNDDTLGYHVTGYFAPTSRYGTPDDFKYFVNAMHCNDIGVIMDWSPSQFPKDEHGLARFDGTCLFEHLDPRQGERPRWNTLIYNYGSNQVKNFLKASALYWVDKYHVDGLRLDSVSEMLYLDYDKNDGEWVANIFGGNENLEAIDFLKELNTEVHGLKAGAITIAEETSGWEDVTGAVNDSDKSLGFDMKWNSAWTEGMLCYMQTDPLFRKGRHGLLTEGMLYQYYENFVTAFSHNEVSKTNKTLAEMMPGSEENKLANLRVLYGYMLAHPGKNLVYKDQFDFTEELKEYVSYANAFYLGHEAMFIDDAKTSGFKWLSTLDADKSVVSFIRKCKNEMLLVVCNFTPVYYEKFKVGVPFAGKYKEIFNSDMENFGGQGHVNPRMKTSKKVKWDGNANSIEIKLAPLSIQIFNCQKMNQ